MNANLSWKILAFSFAIVAAPPIRSWGIEEDVEFSAAPAAVQKTMQAETKGADFTTLSKETEDDRTKYWADVEISGKSYVIGVAEDGTLSELSLLINDEEIALADCPPAVQKTFNEESRGAKIESVERESQLGVTIYLTMVEINGNDYELKVAEDGTLTAKILMIEEDEVDLSGCPAAVQDALRNYARGGTIDEVTRLQGLGKRIYAASVEIGDRSYTIEVDAGGALIAKTLDEDES